MLENIYPWIFPEDISLPSWCSLGGVRTESCVIPTWGSSYSEFCACSQQGLSSIAWKHCIELKEVTDKGHCCVKGELNFGLGVIYCTTCLLGAETNHGKWPEWSFCSVTCVCCICTGRMKLLHKTSWSRWGGKTRWFVVLRLDLYQLGFWLPRKNWAKTSQLYNLEAITGMLLTQGSRERGSWLLNDKCSREECSYLNFFLSFWEKQGVVCRDAMN